jgi:hypothetical protein
VFAVRRFKLQAVCLDRLQMTAACDEDDVLARQRELRAEIAAGASGPEDHEAHLKLLTRRGVLVGR